MSKEKGRAGWHQATFNTSNNAYNFTSLATNIKAVIITLDLWGIFPLAVTNWFILHLVEPHDE